MDVSTILGLIAVVFLVLANGFFVATEFSIVAVRRSRLEQLTQEGRAGASSAQELVRQLDTYIAACQFGITIASLGLGWLGEPALAHLFEAPLVMIFGSMGPAAAHGVAVAIAFSIITTLHIVIGELAPKGLALQAPETTSLFVARPMQIFYALFRWPIRLLNAIGNGTLRLFGLEPAAGHEMVHSVEELRLLVTGMQNAGVVEASEALIAKRAFNFGDLTAGALMTPRTQIQAVAIDSTWDELMAFVRSAEHSRIPIYRDSLDDIAGFLHVHDLFRVQPESFSSFNIESIMRPSLHVPMSQHADDLLEHLRATRQQVAVVADEYGGTAGFVTLEDLIEGLVGQIDDEPSMGEAISRSDPEVEGDGSRLLDGLLRVQEFEEQTGIRVANEQREDADTLGGVVTSVVGRIPEVGEYAFISGRRLRVEERDGQRVARVRLLPQELVASEA